MNTHEFGIRSWPVRLILPAAVCLALVACGGGDSGGQPPPPAPLTVSVTDLTGTVLNPGTTAEIIATLVNDTSTKGVTWGVSCATAPCGSISPTTSANGATATYTAPAARPPANLSVTLTATSVADSSKHASTSLTVAGGLAISIAAPAGFPPDITTGTTITFVATIDNDTANAGADWTLSCDGGGDCGTVSPTHSASGKPVTFTAPTLPNGSVAAGTLTATATSDPTINDSVRIEMHGHRIDVYVMVQGNDASELGAGATAQINADIVSDPSNTGGFSWALSCGSTECGALSSYTSANGEVITYTAPAGPVGSDLAVTATATSTTEPGLQGVASITVRAVNVSVTPDSALVPLSSWSFFNSLVQWAPTESVKWTTVQNGVNCGNACGTFSPGGSPAEVAYHPPSAMPASPAVTLVASSVFDPTKTGSADVQLTIGNVLLAPNKFQLGRRHFTYKGKKKCNDGVGTARLTNVGGASLAISGIRMGGTDPTAFSQSNTCPASLASGNFCDITVKFNCAYSAATSASAEVNITDNSPDSPQILTLTGYTYGSWLSAAMRTTLSLRGTLSTPAPTGGWPVGTQVLSMTSAQYADPYLADGSARDLMVRVWYPSAAKQTCTQADYASPQVWSYYGQLLGISPPQVTTHSCLNARVAARAHPVVVLTHGFTGTSTDYTFLAEDLASRGYVVASVDHTYEATAVAMADGRLATSRFGSHLTRYTRNDVDSLTQAVNVRLGDLRMVLDQLTRLNRASHGEFAGKLDLSRIALVGHSLGGLTTVHALASEPRFKAGVLLDGAVASQMPRSVRQPVLSLTSGAGTWDADECRMWSALQGPRLAVSLQGTDHVAMSDAVWLLDGAVRTGDQTAEQTVTSIRRYVAGFLDSALRGRDTEPAVSLNRANRFRASAGLRMPMGCRTSAR